MNIQRVKSNWRSLAALTLFTFTLGLTSQAFATAVSPSAVTQKPMLATPTSAWLNGMANPNGAQTQAWFEYGSDTSYGNTTAPVDIGSGTSVVAVRNTIPGINYGTALHYRIVATNSSGVVRGADESLVVGQKLRVWGNTQEGDGQSISAVSVAGGSSYTVTLGTDGTVKVFGSSGPAVPAGLSQVVAIASGQNHVLALKSDGTVVAWGANTFGQSDVPAGLNNVIATAAGANHSLALKNDGTLVAWGNSGSGLASGAQAQNNVVAISAGGDHSLALKADGSVAAWGADGNGEAEVPPGLNNIIDISAGGYHNLALKADRTVTAWGYNYFGQSTVPSGLANVIQIAAGLDHSLVLKADGSIMAWGVNNAGQIPTPPNLGTVLLIGAGTLHSFALSQDLRPIANPITLQGPTNTDMTIQLSGFDPVGAGLNFYVLSPPTNGTLYQYNNGSRGSEISSPVTFVNDLGGRVIFAPVANTFGSPYAQFTYLAATVDRNSDPANVTIAIGDQISPRVSVISKDDSGFTLGFSGTNSMGYTVQGSSDLKTWTPLGAPTLVSPGVYQFKDTSAPASNRFYKVTTP